MLIASLGACVGSLASGCKKSQSAPGPQPLFADWTPSSGVRFHHRNGQKTGASIVDTTGSGCAVFDYDNDGWLDIFLVNGAPGLGETNRLYHNERNGTFRDVTEQAGVKGAESGTGMGCAAADFDRDGRLDLYVTYWGSNILYRNRGDGTFEDVTRKAGVAASGFSTAAAFADLDADGWQDLFVVRYCRFTDRSKHLCVNSGVPTSCPPYYYHPEPDLVFRNLGGGRFREVSKEWGFVDKGGRGLGIVPVDYDHDGRLDVFIANDGTPNFLFRNEAPGKFKNVAATENIALDDRGTSLANMGADFGDYLGDGTFAAVTGVFQNETHPLWRYQKGIGFENVAHRSGVGPATMNRLTFGIGFADLTNDGWLDLFLANGHVQDRIAEIDKTAAYEQACSFLVNTGRGTFEDHTAAAGPVVNAPTVGRGLSFGDLDNDGDVDLVLSANNRPARLLRNDHPRKNWISLRLIAKGPNWEAGGAFVELTAGGRKQTRFVHTSYSFASVNDQRLHFGLGDAAEVERVSIRWPNGQQSKVTALKPNQVNNILQPGADPPAPVKALLGSG